MPLSECQIPNPITYPHQNAYVNWFDYQCTALHRKDSLVFSSSLLYDSRSSVPTSSVLILACLWLYSENTCRGNRQLSQLCIMSCWKYKIFCSLGKKESKTMKLFSCILHLFCWGFEHQPFLQQVKGTEEKDVCCPLHQDLNLWQVAFPPSFCGVLFTISNNAWSCSRLIMDRILCPADHDYNPKSISSIHTRYEHNLERPIHWFPRSGTNIWGWFAFEICISIQANNIGSSISDREEKSKVKGINLSRMKAWKWKATMVMGGSIEGLGLGKGGSRWDWKWNVLSTATSPLLFHCTSTDIGPRKRC